MDETLGDRICSAREQLGWTQEKLAEAAGINRVTLAKYEAGRSEPGAMVLSRIAVALGVTADYLLGNYEPTPGDDEAWEIRERLRRDPDYRLLFKAARKATPSHLRAAAAVLKELEPEGPDDDY